MQVLSKKYNNEINITRFERSLEDRVRESLSEFLNFSSDEVRSQENKDKYYDPLNPFVAGPELEEVFGLMKGLNESALRDRTIGTASDGRGSFRDALTETAANIARHFSGRAFDYVELGPEPAKTSFIIGALLARGARIRRYFGVDINPASKQVMQEALSCHLEPDQIRHRITAFDRFALEDIRENAVPALVTTLGFQEGNEDPMALPSFYRRLLDPGDVLLSEMQLRPAQGWGAVRSFYHHPFMRRFSRIAFERVFGPVPSHGGFALVKAGSFVDEDLWAAVLYEMPEAANEPTAPSRHGALPRAFITNFCLKYSARQFQLLRAVSGCQEVLMRNGTGDGSVVFQLSQRV